MTTTNPGELIATLQSKHVPTAELRKLDELARSLPEGSLQDLLKHLVSLLSEGHDVALFYRSPSGSSEWDGFESQRDMVAAMVYNARARSTREMTPERWARIKRDFRGSAHQCLEQADEEIANL